jgi:ribosomal protein S12 methylthiotransferase
LKKTNPKAFYLENLGCVKNQVDGEAIISRLAEEGWTYTESPGEARFIIVNTCGFIEPAKRESIETALALRARFPDAQIILSGCLSQRYGKELFEDLPEINGVFGNKDLSKMQVLFEELKKNERKILVPEKEGPLPKRSRFLSPPGSVYIKIAEGCDNRCSYCAIPLIRGSVRSRTEEDILGEIKTLLAAGFFEINLIAQDLGSYGRDLSGSDGLSGLLVKISALPGDFWIRLLYIHPERFPRELLKTCGQDSRILPYFDIPFQHASAGILKAMGRTKIASENLDLIGEIRSALPEAVLRSTFLVGFPGEKEEDFNRLLEFQEKAEFDWLGVFEYSPEENTPAAGLHRKRHLRVAKPAAAARKKLLEERQTRITERGLERFVGKDLDLLVEEIVQGEDLSLARGRPHAPEVDGLVVLHGTAAAPGTVLRARVIRRNGFDLEAVQQF